MKTIDTTESKECYGDHFKCDECSIVKPGWKSACKRQCEYNWEHRNSHNERFRDDDEDDEDEDDEEDEDEDYYELHASLTALGKRLDKDYDELHAHEWMAKHPHGWYNNEHDYGEDASKK